MSDQRPPRRRPAVSGTRNSGTSIGQMLPTLAGVVAVALAVGFLLIVVNDARGGSNNSNPAASDPTETPTTTAGADVEPTQQPTKTAEATPTETPTEGPTEEPTARPTPTEDKLIPIDCTTILAPADKEHVMGSDCEPSDLVALPAEVTVEGRIERMRADAAAAFEDMVAVAERDGVLLRALSAYRSYQTQVDTYNSNVAAFGQEYADRTSARPGRSEHQMGTTVDVVTPLNPDLGEEFGDTPEGQWVKANSWRFGFIISYPQGKESITGYAYEPWHLRWVGTQVAAQVNSSGLTLHEFLDR